MNASSVKRGEPTGSSTDLDFRGILPLKFYRPRSKASALGPEPAILCILPRSVKRESLDDFKIRQWRPPPNPQPPPSGGRVGCTSRSVTPPGAPPAKAGGVLPEGTSRYLIVGKAGPLTRERDGRPRYQLIGHLFRSGTHYAGQPVRIYANCSAHPPFARGSV